LGQTPIYAGLHTRWLGCVPGGLVLPSLYQGVFQKAIETKLMVVFIVVCTWRVLLSFCTEQYIAIYTYASDEAGDLMFNEGDIISVTRVDGDWWTGNIGHRSGIFPGNFVKKYEEPTVATTVPVEEVELAFFRVRIKICYGWCLLACKH